jgi:hypothetical protein
VNSVEFSLAGIHLEFFHDWTGVVVIGFGEQSHRSIMIFLSHHVKIHTMNWSLKI